MDKIIASVESLKTSHALVLKELSKFNIMMNELIKTNTPLVIVDELSDFDIPFQTIEALDKFETSLKDKYFNAKMVSLDYFKYYYIIININFLGQLLITIRRKN